MRIFDRLFKQNVEKMLARKDAEGLMKALKHKDSTVRWKAASALGEIGDARAVEPLIQALKNEDRDVRRRAADALGEIGDARAVEPLIEVFHDLDSGVKKDARLALGMIVWQPKDDLEKAYYLNRIRCATYTSSNVC